MAIVMSFMIEVQISAQSADSFREQTNIEPGVEAWQLTRHGNLSPSLYTGAMEWSLPLYTYKDPDFELPISLQYHYDGFRPRESTGSIGLGWALNAGGVITREVRGLKDEYHKTTEDNEHIFGYYHAWRNSLDMTPGLWGGRYSLLRQYVFYSDSNNSVNDSFLEIVRTNMPEDIILCRATSYYERYEIDPDVFRFCFCGHSGEFRFGPSGRIDVICPHEPNNDIDIEVGSIMGPDCETFTFTITTADGYKYTFGTTEASLEYTTSGCRSSDDPYSQSGTLSSDEPVVTAWRLTGIKSPGGRELRFEYEPSPDIEATLHESFTPSVERLDIIADPRDTIPSYMNSWVSFSRTRLISRISLYNPGSGTDRIVEFNWCERNTIENEHVSANYDRGDAILQDIHAMSNHSNRKLQRMIVRNRTGMEVEKVAFEYDVLGTFGGPRRLILSTISSKTSGEWTFAYNPIPSGDSLPAADARAFMDIFGYWGGDSWYDKRIFNEYGDGSLTYQSGSENYSLGRSSAGGLVRIYYPTGGSTSIEYEKNHVNWLLDRDWYNYPHLELFQRDVSGVRVCKMTDYDGDNIAVSKSFLYEDGVLWHFPRTTVQCDFFKNVYNPYGGGYASIRLRSNFYSSAGFGTHGNGTRLGYGKVTVRSLDGSRKEYEFSGWTEYPDVFSEQYTSFFSDISAMNDTQLTKMMHLFLPASQDWSLFRGMPKSEMEYDSDNNLRHSIELTYRAQTPTLIYDGLNLFESYGIHARFKMKPLLMSRTETRDGLTVQTDWRRNYEGRLIEERVEDIQSGCVKQGYYTYCDGITSSDASVCRGAVRDIITLSREQSESEMKVTGYIRFGYNRSDGSAKPSTMTVYQLDTPVSESAISSIPGTVPQYTTRVTRDSRLLPTRVDMPGGAYISYTWDTAGRNILSRAVNGTRDVTTYTWKDMVGLASVEYPSGMSESYTYDNWMRLSGILDSDGHQVHRLIGRLASELEWRGLSRIEDRHYLDEEGVEYTIDVEHFDGLGRKAQVVGSGGYPGRPSTILPVVYDSMGRSDIMSYLPYPSANVSFEDMNYNYSMNWQTELSQWYESEYSDGSRPYTQREYEPWSGGRVLSEQKPGAVYEQSGKRIHYQYGHNMAGDGVLRFTVSQPNLESTSVRCAGVWDAGQLHRSMRISEEGDTTVVFSDVAGRALLSRSIGDGVNHDTYYIRDLRDSVVMVIQPEGSLRLSTGTVIPFGGTFAHDYCFGWVYDGLGRMVWSHVPGDGGTNYAYDIRGRLVYSDDANLRAAGKGRYYLYDTYDRLTEEGICVPCVDIDGIRVGLLNGATIQDMTGSRQDTHKLTYRETSSALSGGIPLDMQFEAVEGVVSSSDVRRDRCLTMLSFEKLREISSTVGGYTRRAYWYNAQGRLVQMLEKTSDGWTSRYSTRYDFVGNVVKYCEQHKEPSGRTHVLLTENTYDGRGRLTRCVRTLDGVELDPVDYSYDALGRANGKARDQIGASYKIRETLSRNMQGWITGIEVERPSGSVFSENITHRYDGFIEETQIGNVRNRYAYDHLGRLTGNSRWVNGVSTEVGTEKNISYDRNGNLTFLQRNLTGTADEIYFGYQGNRIVGGCINPQTEFLELMFSSDANGNLTENYYEGVSVSYNFLNLPSVDSGITYTYLSDGTRLSARKSDGSGVVARGSFSYAVSAGGSVALESVAHSEGRIYVGTPDGDVWDCWNVTDHLGNVRSVVNPDGSGMEFMLEQSDYLPFGMRLNQSSPLLSDLQRWHYAGKEYQKFGSTDLGLIDFGARYYSPFLGRWSTLDPLANKYLATSPYGYCGSNPLNFVDPEGMAVYLLSVDGFITLLEDNDDNMDILYSSLESDSVFLVYDQGILKNLSSTDINGVRKASTHSKESIGLFYFLADNTNVEWAIHIKETESGLVYALGTVGKSDSAASYSAYMNSKPDISMHSHPDVMPTLIEELGSMGIYIVGDNSSRAAYRILDSDWDHVSNNLTAPVFYVYFPNSYNRYTLNHDGYNVKKVK